MSLNSFQIFFFCAETLIAACSFCGNLLIIAIFTFDKKLQIKRNFLLSSLAFANLMRALLEIPFSILVNKKLLSLKSNIVKN